MCNFRTQGQTSIGKTALTNDLSFTFDICTSILKCICFFFLEYQEAIPRPHPCEASVLPPICSSRLKACFSCESKPLETVNHSLQSRKLESWLGVCCSQDKVSDLGREALIRAECFLGQHADNAWPNGVLTANSVHSVGLMISELTLIVNHNACYFQG